MISISTQQGAALVTSALAPEGSEASEVESPAKDDDAAPTISGPPALQTAIGDDANSTVYLPLTIKQP